MTTTAIDTDTYRIVTEQRIIRQLALEWIRSDLPADTITFVECLRVLTHLQAVTKDAYQTETLFEIVFEQAQQLRKSSEWLSLELQFETSAVGVANRQELIRSCLDQTHPIDDAALDAYNERLTRSVDQGEIRIYCY